MKRSTLITVSGALVALATAALCIPQNKPAGPSFQKEVLPILRTACLGCHSAEMPTSGLALNSYAALMKGGKGGPCIVAGKSADSRLVKYLLGTLQPKMPPGGALKQADIDRIRQWIDAGAKVDAATEGGAKPGTASLPGATNSTGPHPNVIPNFPRVAAATPVTSLAFSTDGHTLAVGIYREVQFWDMDTRQIKGRWSGLADAVRTLVFTKDGKRLAAGGGTPTVAGDIRVWDMAAGREVAMMGSDHTDAINALAFNPDGTKLASASGDKTLRIWDVATGKALQTLRDHSDAVWGVAWSPDGKYLASAGADRSLKVWDANSRKRLYSLPAHEDTIFQVEFSPDGKMLVTASADRSAKVWGFGPESSTNLRTFSGYAHNVQAATFASDNNMVATASADKSVKVWSMADGSNTRTFTDAQDWVYSVRFSPDRKHLAAGVWDGSVLLWSLTDGKLEGRLDTVPKK
ncbi:MAG TPA: c-type cytochrome domain-containing protein [Chthonomonadaceae bacterium]|nr:c-type cytochrome domain-containing protein [Chthonomonadaceae bacterium]